MKRAALVLLLGLVPATASAQYFGQSKVHYKDFSFQVLRTERFDVYFYPEERQAAEQAGRLAERWYARLSRLLQHELRGRQPLILYASHPDFEQTNVIAGPLGEGTGGVTELARRRIVLPLAGPLAETDHVIGHELVHAFQFDITAPAPRGQVTTAGAERLPLWFIEGMAEYLSIGHVDPHTAMWMRDAIAGETLPAIKDLNSPKYFPYRWGHALWAFVAGRWGDRAVGELLRAAKATGDPDAAFQEVIGLTAEQLSAEWHAALRSAYARSLERAQPPSAFGRLVIGRTGTSRSGGELNVSPALSPDGRTIAFLSERDLFSVELFLADVQTGRIIRRLTETAVDPHTSSLQFIRSAAAWSPDGGRLAVPAIRSGRAALVIVKAENGDREQEIRFDEVGEVYNPAWSPDGRSIVFAATVGGYTDLFVHGLADGTTRRLTNDAFADLQPAWSPDGSTIAFVTDRFSTRLPDLSIGPYRLATIRPSGGAIEPVRGLDGSKHISPQWSSDGRRLYFLSDHGGATNVYALDLTGGLIVQITNLLTGASGITATSPALAAASRAEIVTFSAYERGMHQIYAIDSAPALAGGPVAQGETVAAALPPFSRHDESLLNLLGSTTIGLPEGNDFSVEGYRPRLELDYVGQPSISVGVDRFGTFAGGGVGFFFSDLLGNHNLATAVQINSTFGRGTSFKDIAGFVAYQNLENRWNWGISAEQIPYVSGGISSALIGTDSGPVVLEELHLIRETNHALTGVVAYPFNRAQRVEFSGGVRRIGFDRTIEQTVYSFDTGQILAEDTIDLPAPDPLNLGQAAAALVYDTSIFGATSPVLGQRYRLEWAANVGSIRFNNLLADYRRYFMPARFYTLALRGLHFGRYGRDAQDPLLAPLYLGYPTLVRGYDVGSFDIEDCPEVNAPCESFERLIGSRLLVANVELRFPLFRPLGVSRGMYGPIPAEIALFADTGVAWSQGETPSFFGGERRPVSSVGAALRVNVLGFAVAEFDFVRPLDRRTRGWRFQFGFTPGF